MDRLSDKVGFGGGCHWCTEAVFQSLIGVRAVEQGWITSSGDNSSFSEAIIVHFDTYQIKLSTLISIHLFTHSCTSNHSMRQKYRSAVYIYDEEQADLANQIILQLQKEFTQLIITRVLPFVTFKTNSKEFLNYYYTNPERQFCQRYINPKLQLLLKKYSKQVDTLKLKSIIETATNEKQ